MLRVPFYLCFEKGYKVLVENRFSEDLIGRFRRRKSPTWTPQTVHRMNLIDVLLALEIGVRSIEFLEIVKVFLEFNRIKIGSRYVYETTDFVDGKRIVPDAAFILNSAKADARALFFVELDMGTEGIASRIEGNQERRLVGKFANYDEYLESRKYSDKYSEWGDFDYFMLLFVTTSEARVENIRAKLNHLNSDYHEYYFFNTMEAVKDNFFRTDWRSRSISVSELFSILGMVL